MHMNELAGKWHEIKGSIKEYFSDLTDDDLLEIEADHEKLLGKVQQRYNLDEEAAEAVISNMKITDDGKITDSSMVTARDLLQSEGDIEAARRFNAEQNKFVAEQKK